MKIEMGESLFYSWLRHVKECQIVQTNWTTSSQWQLNNEEHLEEIMTLTDKFFFDKYGYSIYKKTSSLSQLLQQAECDAIGVEIQGGTNKIYAVDVAFHEAGVNYGGREATIKKIISKSLRTAMWWWHISTMNSPSNIWTLHIRRTDISSYGQPTRSTNPSVLMKATPSRYGA